MSKNMKKNKRKIEGNNISEIKEKIEEEVPKKFNNNNLNNNINDETAKLNEDQQYQYFLSHFNGEKPKLRPELKELQKEVLHYGSDIIDEENQSKYEDRPIMEKLGHKLYKIYEVVEHYLHVFLSLATAIYIIYYTNLFYNLYFNPKINRFYLYLSALLFITDIFIFMYIYIYLPYIKKLDENTVEKHFDEAVPYCSGILVGGIVCLIISMWSVYRWYSIPMVLLIFWGIIMSANIIQNGMLGNIFFVSIITTMLFSYKFIKGPGKTYY
jgi:hypothetical protein